ncbi:hypothetical protein D9619_012412 [Psilocybe cf. subviscida]|uniref:Uncharacterized protein n=1 Tax=Psilocybe cf. subviscida TaxID=2480587 RepID=A0A8H5ASN2_9AGAR|nr:hypothetical protein D9619_012412 [Psilocybe cf. subviscida]
MHTPRRDALPPHMNPTAGPHKSPHIHLHTSRSTTTTNNHVDVDSVYIQAQRPASRPRALPLSAPPSNMNDSDRPLGVTLLAAGPYARTAAGYAVQPQPAALGSQPPPLPTLKTIAARTQTKPNKMNLPTYPPPLSPKDPARTPRGSFPATTTARPKDTRTTSRRNPRTGRPASTLSTPDISSLMH